MNSLISALNIRNKEMISFVGAGGKTTAMFELARRLKSEDRKILVTTTTKIMLPDKKEYDKIIFDNSEQINIFMKISPNTVTCLGRALYNEHNKVTGINSGYLDRIFENNIFDYILIEADGAKRKPIKAPAGHEPVIPSKTTMTIGMIGLDSINKPLNEENVHRADIFAAVTGGELGSIIDENMIAELILSEKGIFKNSPAHSRKTIIFNKAEELSKRESAKSVIEKITKEKGGIRAIIASFKEKVIF